MRRHTPLLLAAAVLVAGCVGESNGAVAPATTAAPASTSTTLVDFGETEGCSAEFWRTHVSLWDDDGDIPMTDELGLRPPQTLETAFSWRQQGIEPWARAHPDVVPLQTATILDALGFTDGGGVDGAARTLLRTMAAAYLSAAYEGIQFPYRRFGPAENGNPPLSQLLAAALEAGDETTLRELAGRLQEAISLECPL